MKLKYILKDSILEGKLSDWPGYNTPAALNKEKEIKNKKIKPEDAITDLDSEFDTFHKMDKINASLLEAHDTIRKMQDKPIIYSHLSLKEALQHGVLFFCIFVSFNH